MKIVIPTIGSRGDVQPFIALAQGLGRVGHSVTLTSHPVMKPLVQSHGVTFSPIGPDIDLAQKAADIRQNSRSPAVGLIRVMRFSFDMLERSHEDILAICRGADLVVISAQSAAGKNEADLLGLPFVSVTLMPWAIPWSDPERPIAKRIVYGAIDGLVHMITTRPLNRMRKKLGLPPVGEEGFTSTRLNLIPVSPAVYPPNPLWEPRHRMVGYWFAEPPGDWQPSGDLITFLENGSPPILVSLGAMSLGDRDELETARLFVNAIREADVRAIIQGWEASLGQLDPPEEIHAAGSLPHSWLLPRCAAIVHHGGFGTTSAGLRAGIPAVVIPHVADQFYWGQQVQQLGVGPAPIPRNNLTAERLAHAIRQAVTDEAMRQHSVDIGSKIQAEDGVTRAVEIIQ